MKYLIITTLMALNTASASAASYALIVGNNEGGAGQQDLRYAEDDARRVAEVLIGHGRFNPDDVRVVLGTSKDELVAALDELTPRLQEHAGLEEPVTLFFYYSGHARSKALNLGAEELELTELRERLIGLPTTLTTVVLDACQSGAFSGVKGSEPAADFSVNSVERLQMSGLAVMASSSGAELSQESETLGASYFTHHLLTAMRGAGDSDADGRVTLDEAYQYAYNNTLTATARTAVGRQHVTLETDLRGKGDVVLTYPAQTLSGLGIGSSVTGEILVQRQPAGTVVAEIDKAAGDSLRLALAPGLYVAHVRSNGEALRCEMELATESTTTLQLDVCERVEIETTVSKGEHTSGAGFVWGLELGIGLSQAQTDGYTKRLEDFGFAPGSGVAPYWSVAATLTYGEYFSLVLALQTLSAQGYSRSIDDAANVSRQQGFNWEGWAPGLAIRAGYPLFNGVLTPYAQAGGGVAIVQSVFHDEVDPSSNDIGEVHVGYHLNMTAGLSFMPWEHLGAFAQFEFLYAPSLRNELGDEHNNGGLIGSIGIRGAL